MKTIIKPTIPFVLSTALTGFSCYLSGMPRRECMLASIVAALVSGTVAYAVAFVRSRRFHKDSNAA